jgi:hypothetical protein
VPAEPVSRPAPAAGQPSAASLKAFDTVAKWLEQRKVKYTRVETNGGKLNLIANFALKNGNVRIVGFVRDSIPVVVFNTAAPINVPEERRGAAAEFVARANNRLWVGCFELDYATGQISYVTSVDVQDGELTPRMVQSLFVTNIKTMDKYLPGIIQIIGGNVSPEEAIASIEKPKVRQSQVTTRSVRSAPARPVAPAPADVAAARSAGGTGD